MKTHTLLFCLLMICVNIGTFAQKATKSASKLQGVWQLCSSCTPMERGTYQVRTLPVMKVISSDYRFSNIRINLPESPSLLTASGTCRILSDSIFVEDIEQSAYKPFNDVKNEIHYRFLEDNILLLRFVMPDTGKEWNETWVRVCKPASSANL